ncbi:carboxypeptidase-like regulatory domain-containing protein [Aporhodopirellula aestuarii]|uniref:Carboxypeptidase-like regulatory domain-containing protein n=1 Tax=Aporhodopirellula aestuarii TaxID=2950107 RepID=A0ABT0UDZ7_9BACT|nr:carboxypeptidase-like regulatory domain-containing protein [Aporhodopirellula aestuarii]MCM2375123.1 carboxypeptidase-like regulatory domain-containing protein [Aporhodopirellula aestuarii]
MDNGHGGSSQRRNNEGSQPVKTLRVWTQLSQFFPSALCVPLTGRQMLAVLSLFASCLLGCSSSQPLLPVTGRVTADGQPFAGATIVFDGAEPNVYASAVTGSDGNYSLEQDDGGAGTPSGKYIVRIFKLVSREGDVLQEQVMDEDAMEEELASIVPSKFNTQTTLSAEVTLENDRFDFEVELVPMENEK